MKASAILRIILFSLVILLLGTALLAGLGCFHLRFDIDTGKEYSAGGSSVLAEELNNIHIEWAAGTVSIVTGNTDEITFSESGDASQPLVYALTGKTLTIRYAKPGIVIGLFQEPAKDLTVTVPAYWYANQINVETASADVHVSRLHASNVRINSASAESRFENCVVDELTIETASGAVFYSGSLVNASCSSASGDLTFCFSNVPQRVSVSSASGDLELSLPQNASFRAEMDSLSGKFGSNFAYSSYPGHIYSYTGSSKTCCDISFSSASGDLILQKADLD